ncbi:LysR family transcriptional regulator, partial [Listeria monocytogenes]|nr:LysR family transcriptional regulator [Listeria monocytogenes]
MTHVHPPFFYTFTLPFLILLVKFILIILLISYFYGGVTMDEA